MIEWNTNVYDTLNQLFNGCKLHSTGNYGFFIKERYVILFNFSFIKYSIELTNFLEKEHPELSYLTIESNILAWVRTRSNEDIRPFEEGLMTDRVVDDIIVLVNNMPLIDTLVKRLLMKTDVYFYKKDKFFMRNNVVFVIMQKDNAISIRDIKIYDHIGIDVKSRLVSAMYDSFFIDLVLKYLGDGSTTYLSGDVGYLPVFVYQMEYMGKGSNFIKN